MFAGMSGQGGRFTLAGGDLVGFLRRELNQI